jgi:hypothetical protein
MRCTVTDLQNTQGCGASFDKELTLILKSNVEIIKMSSKQ